MSYWDRRAKRYNNLETVQNKRLYDVMIKASKIKITDKVLDAGAGTGRLSKKLKPLCSEVIALEPNAGMAEQIKDVRVVDSELDDMSVVNNYFDKVFCRLVLHHITNLNTLFESLIEMARVLRDNGVIIIHEGIPPNKNLVDDYKDIFEFKEKRLVMTPEFLTYLLGSTGFKNIKTEIHTQKDFSVKTWLNNDITITQSVRDYIFNLHKKGSREFKRAYNLREVGNDILIDVKYCIATGLKDANR